MAPKKFKKLPLTEPEGPKRRLLASQARATQDSNNEGIIPSSQNNQIPQQKFNAAKDLGLTSDEDMEEEVTVLKFPSSQYVLLNKP